MTDGKKLTSDKQCNMADYSSQLLFDVDFRIINPFNNIIIVFVYIYI